MKIVEKQNPYAVFVMMLLLALASWYSNVNFESWSELFTPKIVFSLCGAVGSVLGALLVRSPIKPRS
jgi:hypothetical protein